MQSKLSAGLERKHMNPVIPLYIFDLDGTLALCDHRVHILSEDCTDKWSKFYDLCDKDTPNTSLIEVMDTLRNSISEIRILTGRREDQRDKTIAWLLRYSKTFRVWGGNRMSLIMRPKGNHMPDDELKEGWLREMDANDILRLVCVFEDRDRVVQMWRRNGLTCLQVRPGNF